jgi:acetyl/propionyl-CoA carboxylase alpha subunit/acetyl-CoA carboxylase carboxyltransferase component
MPQHSLLVANRGEIAIRILRAASELGLGTVAVYSEDDAASLHVRRADRALALAGRGGAAYLDAEQLVRLASEAGCSAIHPGYGFLAESAAFAQRCDAAGLTFIGPLPETLALLGDKVEARSLARLLGVPVLEGSDGPVDAAGAHDFFASLEAGAGVVIKAVSGGGGRGMRLVRNAAELPDAFALCQREARAAFGDDALYVERLVERARHIEVQILGDGTGQVCHLWERECTLQRRHQKLIEIAPSPHLDATLRQRMLNAALRLAAEARYLGLGTFEFLIDAEHDRADGPFWFIEANPRLQVEHTVTEEITGTDLVRAQIRVCMGESLEALGLTQAAIPEPRGFALQARVNMETMAVDGSVRPAGGVLALFEPPTGPGVRVDSFGYTGYATNPAFDSLLAKVIAHSASPRFDDVVLRARRALAEFRIEGVATNLGLLRALLAQPDLAQGRVHTRYVQQHAARLVTDAAELVARETRVEAAAVGTTAHAGARVDSRDPLAVLAHGKAGGESSTRTRTSTDTNTPPGTVAVKAPMQGTVVALEAAVGAEVGVGAPVIVMEAMKMQHVIGAPESGVLHSFGVRVGDTVYADHALAFLTPGDVASDASAAAGALDLDRERDDLRLMRERHAFGLDANRPEAVAKRHGTGHRTARENLADLVDPDSFVEYGPLVIAAQRRRRSEQELREKTSADGLVGGLGRVNGALFGPERSQCVVASYDYMVLAGTQGQQNHRKKDRLFELAAQHRLPVVLFAEGGGGRPGDTDSLTVAGLDCMAFALYGKLSGLVPLVGIVSGRCFAGNAALLGCSDVVIATRDANIGMGGPAMIEGGGLGVFSPEEVGPTSVQAPNGVIDVLVEDEAEAVRVARQYLSYFQGALAEWSCDDQRKLRFVVPENRLRVYDIREAIRLLADADSVLELRAGFAPGMITALVRIEGKPVGVIANNPAHLGGAIDAPAADKAARFMQLCDAHELPVLFLCDTPGIMVGPEAEKTALVRHVARMFVTGANLSVPFFSIILRKAYGLGAMLMAGGSFKAPFFCVGWPSAELGGMGLEGAIKLALRKELAAIEDPEQRRQTFEKLVASAYDHGRGVNVASHFEFDDVIDPVDSRRWIGTALNASPPRPRSGKKRPCIDTW